ncbi:exopolysaccharide biosynthesis protein [Rhodohalobacter sp. 614A]|uniref:exopolysaccharide biosynthesis protein n=1 Tax=Rhodohalobacter sp. 614A TaxID=2908649 RepID=UPI001F1DEBEE|nr:exopolysaccharide biosynthesis protein [Rhodohalobacter sp. 614A]
MSKELSNLEDLIVKIKNADGDGNKVSFDDILDKIGRRSFAPLLLLAGIITLAPLIGDIPGVPTIMGIFVILTTGQLLFGREQFWLPNWILKRSAEKKKINKGMEWLKKPATFIDKWSKPRLTVFTKGAGHYVIAAVCFLIALAMPVMEVIPFSANVAGIAFALFGLSLITHDGILAILALLFALGTFGIVIYGIL